MGYVKYRGLISSSFPDPEDRSFKDGFLALTKQCIKTMVRVTELEFEQRWYHVSDPTVGAAQSL